MQAEQVLTADYEIDESTPTLGDYDE